MRLPKVEILIFLFPAIFSTKLIEFRNQIQGEEMRGTIRQKQAVDFCRWSGSLVTFKALFSPGELSVSGEGQHRVYRAADIRKARLALMDVHVEPRRANTLPPIIYVRMAKGGVGKTTVAGNVSACLAMQGYKVLMIDTDPQASLTSLFGIDWATEEILHIGKLLQAHYENKNPLDNETLEKAIRPIYPDGMLDLIASDITLTNLDSWLISAVRQREKLVQRFFDAHVNLLSRYDVIVIDGAPSTSQLSFSLMYAARNLLAVVGLDGQSVKAMEVMASNIQEMSEEFPEVEFDFRIIANNFVSNISTCTDSLEALRKAYPDKVDPNIIPRAASFMRQVSLEDDDMSAPVIEKEPNSVAARAMVDLSQSLIGAYGIQLAGLLPLVLPRSRGPKKKT